MLCQLDLDEVMNEYQISTGKEKDQNNLIIEEMFFKNQRIWLNLMTLFARERGTAVRQT